jgi:hypothetical protein
MAQHVGERWGATQRSGREGRSDETTLPAGTREGELRSVVDRGVSARLRLKLSFPWRVRLSRFASVWVVQVHRYVRSTCTYVPIGSIAPRLPGPRLFVVLPVGNSRNARSRQFRGIEGSRSGQGVELDQGWVAAHAMHPCHALREWKRWLSLTAQSVTRLVLFEVSLGLEIPSRCAVG